MEGLKVVWVILGTAIVLGMLYLDSRLDRLTGIENTVETRYSQEEITPSPTGQTSGFSPEEDTLYQPGNLDALNVAGRIPEKEPVTTPQEKYGLVVGRFPTAKAASTAMKTWEQKGYRARVIFPEGTRESTFSVSIFESRNRQKVDSLRKQLLPGQKTWVLVLPEG